MTTSERPTSTTTPTTSPSTPTRTRSGAGSGTRHPSTTTSEHDFFALSRFDDVERCSVDWRTYISGKGSVLEAIKSGMEMPPGVILFEDPPAHDLHRGLLSRVFTPRRMLAIEPQVRAFCAAALDPLVEDGPVRLHRRPRRPDADEDHRDAAGDPRGRPGGDPRPHRRPDEAAARRGRRGRDREADFGAVDGSGFAAYIDWRAEHPSDDLMTDLLNAEFEDETGTVRRLTRDEVLNYVGLIAAAGNETTTRLIGWAGKVLAENPDQRRELVDDPTLIPARRRGAAPLRVALARPGPLRHPATSSTTARPVAEGSVMLLINGSANRDERKFPDPDRFDIHRRIDHHVAFGYGIHFCLGAALARLEGRVALEEVLKRFPEWDVDWDNAVRAHTSTVRGWESLPVTTS